MDDYIKRLIERRALQLAKICEHILLNEDSSDEVAAAGFRWGYLILRKPRRYLEEFKHGSLLIDPQALQRAFWFNQEAIEGLEGMMTEEELVLEEFNNEALTWMKENSRTAEVVPLDETATFKNNGENL